MPIIQNSEVRMPQAADNRRERAFVSSHNGAASLTVKEVELLPGWEGRLHTHPTDVAIMVTAGAVQVVMGDHVETVRAGCTIFAPPGQPHKLINKLWVPVILLVTYPSTQLETDYLE
jgi:quercetin dioxygenase-like cupin family protein